ncbi:hypothetical protein ABEB36_010624 [Hypothenemus hampei]|uniref:F-box domain-containing protein n=1 Tax=Hypothenemus hampei TaxID=57062 RepID=A0ABD1ECJ0_HYPHA
MYTGIIKILKISNGIRNAFPLVRPLKGKVLYEGLQTLICKVVPEKELEANSNAENFTEVLPTEVLYNIFSYLDLRSLSRCAQVNKKWNSIASDLHFYQKVDLKMYWNKFNIDTLGKLKEKLQIVRKLDMTSCNDFTLIRASEYHDNLTSIVEKAKNTLTHLCLNHTNCVSEVTMQQIFKCSNLEELRLRNIRLDWLHNGWSKSCKELMSLKTLDIRLSTLNLFDDCNNLGNVELIIKTVVNYNPKLKSWTSSRTFHFKDNSQAYEEFAKLTNLEYLDLTFCQPRPYGSSWLKCIAMHCKKLKRLELGCWKQLTDEDLIPVLTQCKELSHLYIPCTPNISSWALSMACKNLPNLRHICVWCEKITKEMVEDWAANYKHVNIYRMQ